MCQAMPGGRVEQLIPLAMSIECLAAVAKPLFLSDTNVLTGSALSAILYDVIQVKPHGDRSTL
jgi:hypothetical protein